MLIKLTVGAILLFALLTSILPAAGCTPSQMPASTGNEDDKVNLVGNVSEEQLYNAFPEWRESASGYSPKPEILEQLRKMDSKLEIVVFFGTWCGDSRSEVPKFLRVYDTVANSNFSLRMYGVDQSKREGKGLSERLRIEKVPTIIIFSGDKELGRIVEYPKKTIEEDFLAIVSDTRPALIPDSYPDDEDGPDTEVV